MWTVMRKAVVAGGLCVFIGLHSLVSVQAAVNYEACPFCGTQVDRYTERRLTASIYAGMCNVHSDCLLYNEIYDVYDVVRCQTPGCPINHESEHQDYTVETHKHFPANT